MPKNHTKKNQTIQDQKANGENPKVNPSSDVKSDDGEDSHEEKLKDIERAVSLQDDDIERLKRLRDLLATAALLWQQLEDANRELNVFSQKESNKILIELNNRSTKNNVLASVLNQRMRTLPDSQKAEESAITTPATQNISQQEPATEIAPGATPQKENLRNDLWATRLRENARVNRLAADKKRAEQARVERKQREQRELARAKRLKEQAAELFEGARITIPVDGENFVLYTMLQPSNYRGESVQVEDLTVFLDYDTWPDRENVENHLKKHGYAVFRKRRFVGSNGKRYIVCVEKPGQT